MGWFTEDPKYLYLGCVLALLALVGLWRTNPRRAWLNGMFIVAVAAVGIYGLERAVVTDRERIDAGVVDLVESFRKQDLKRTLGHVSETAVAERQLITSAIGMAQIDDSVHVADMQVTMLDGDRATARFRVNGTANLAATSRRVSTRWELSFAREEGEWKVTRIQRMRLLKDEYVEPLNTSEI